MKEPNISTLFVLFGIGALLVLISLFAVNGKDIMDEYNDDGTPKDDNDNLTGGSSLA
jgi:hypothetical protein